MLQGDKIKRVPGIFSGSTRIQDQKGNQVSTSLPCVVTYIHPKHRFYTVRFTLPGGNAAHRWQFYPVLEGMAEIEKAAPWGGIEVG